jgi:hypothetical protein
MESNNNCKQCKCIDGTCSPDLVDNTPDLETPALDLNILVNEPLNVEYVDVDIPIFDPTININIKEEVDLENVITDIERTANFNSLEESIQALNNPDTIFTRLQNAFYTFKEEIGRQMTYSEMRNMMG